MVDESFEKILMDEQSEDEDIFSFREEDALMQDKLKDWQRKYTKKRQKELQELKELREKVKMFEELEKYQPFQEWKKREAERVAKEQFSFSRDIDEIKGKMELQEIESEMSKLEEAVDKLGLPPVSKYYKKMEEILREKAQSSPDGKVNITIDELYCLAAFPDLLNSLKVQKPPFFETSGGEPTRNPASEKIIKEIFEAGKTRW